jgi:two-component system, cell cycle sensor histidine kinase and response regulator CckA
MADLAPPDLAPPDYAQIVSLSLDAIIVVDRQYRYQFANPVYLQWVDKTAAQVLGQTIAAIEGQEIFEQLLQAPLEHCFGGERLQLESWVNFPQLGRQFISYTYAPQVDADQQISGAIISLRNLTALKQTESILSQQAEGERLVASLTQKIRQSLNLQEILTTTVTLVREHLHTDRVIVLQLNSQGRGSIRQEAVAPNCPAMLTLNRLHREFAADWLEQHRQGDIAVIDVDNSRLPPRYVEFLQQLNVKSSLSAPILLQGQRWGLLMLHECAQQRYWSDYEIELLQQLANQLSIALTQSQLVAQLREQATFLDVATDAILVRDLQQRIQYWNSSAAALYGWSAQEAMGQNFNLLFADSPSRQFYLPLQTVMNTGQWQGELEKVSKSGKHLTVASRWTLISEPSDEPKLILMVDTDITDKKKLEAQFLRTQRIESLGTLAGGMAHDLNNLFTPILMTAQILQRRFTDPSNQELLKILEVNTQQGADLVKQVLTFAEGAVGKRTPLKVGLLLADMSRVIHHTFPKNIQVNYTDPAPDLWLIRADVTQLHQVVMNLCVNARDAMPDGGELALTAINQQVLAAQSRHHDQAQPGFYVVIQVKDNGTGMTPTVQERMFEPFFTTKDIGKGTGLGLSTVLGIVTNYNGFVEVETKADHGSTFRVYLPAEPPLPTSIEPNSVETAG